MPKFKRKTPCQECPFLRKSIPGYLGEARAQDFIESTLYDAEMPCHMAIDYSDPNWVDTQLPDADICAGAAQFLCNFMKMPRTGAMAEAVREMPDGQPRAWHRSFGEEFPQVFGTPDEFLAHHDNDMNKAIVERPQE